MKSNISDDLFNCIYLNDFCDRPLRDLNPARKLLVELLLVPGGQLGEEGGRGVVLVALLRLVAGFRVETLKQNAYVFVQLIPISETKNYNNKHSSLFPFI